MKNLTLGTFASRGDAERAINQIHNELGVPTDEISYVYRNTEGDTKEVNSDNITSATPAEGAKSGAVIGGSLGALAGIATVIGIGIALLIGGAIVTETVFALPGIGRLTVDAILRRDYPIIQGVVLIFSAAYVLINLAVDLSYMLFDPRIRY